MKKTDNNGVEKNEEKINSQKPIKRILIVVIIILLIVIIGTAASFVYFNYDNILFGMKATWKYENIIVEESRKNYNNKESNIEFTYVFTMNKKGKCEDCRILISNLDEKTQTEMYDGFSHSEGTISNIKNNAGEISMNINQYNGMTKDEIINWAKKANYSISEI